MSEPVGNSPRVTGDIPGNSHKEREVKAAKEVEQREPVQKIIEGKVVTKKQSWWKKASRSLVADDAQSIGDYLLTDVVVPAVKNLIRDVIVGGVDRSLYGYSRGRSSDRRGEPRSLRTRYDRMADRDEPRRMMSRESRATHDFDDVVLDNRAEAIDVIENLVDRVARYGAASVSDLYDLVGVTGSYADRNWGWSNLDSADVRQYRGAWMLVLPKPDPLR